MFIPPNFTKHSERDLDTRQSKPIDNKLKSLPTAERDLSDTTERGPERCSWQVPGPPRLRSLRGREAWRWLTPRAAPFHRGQRREASCHARARRARKGTGREKQADARGR